jgi:hypothetical protein
MGLRRHLLFVLAATSLAASPWYCPDDVTSPSPTTGLVSLTADSTGTADGVSTTRIEAVVDTTLPVSRWVVTMKTTAGFFTLGSSQTVSLAADPAGHAVVYLQAPRDSAVAQIIASAGPAGGLVLTRTITYKRAQAEAIVVVPKSLSIPPGPQGGGTDITARLLRSIGRPSPQLQVTFVATDSATGAKHGRFTPAPPSDSLGLITVSFTPAATPSDSMYHGTLMITATAVRTDNLNVSGSAVIIVR